MRHTKVIFVAAIALLQRIEAFIGKHIYNTRTNRRMPSFSHKSLLYQLNRKNSPADAKSDSWRHYDPEYIKALQDAAKDPKKFEEFIATRSKLEEKEADMIKQNENQQLGLKNSRPSGDESLSSTQAKKSGYVPIEQWDKEQQELLKEMSWEQRVQFEGQRNGDRFRQNEILRKNLKIF